MSQATVTTTEPPALTPSPAGSGGRLRLTLHQIRYEQLSFWRNPQSVFFTFALPVMIIVIFGAVFGGNQPDSFFYGLSGMQYFTPTVAALSVFGACYGQLAVSLSIRRQSGILKRLHATPLPAWTYFAGLLAHALVVSAVEVALITIVGSCYGVPLPAQSVTAVASLALGAVSFCALGVGVSSLISDSEAASAVVQFIQFPLMFISGNYFPIHQALLDHVADALPMRPLNQALLGSLTAHGGVPWQQLGVLLAWGVVGTLVAVRRFRWDTRR
jgi:ABC-2 type transport system permease protein